MRWLTDSWSKFSRNIGRSRRRDRGDKSRTAKHSKTRSLQVEKLEVRQLLTIDLSGVTHQVLANQNVAPAFVETGSGWQNYSESDAFGGNFDYHSGTDGSDGAAATWSFSSLDPSQSYQCFVAYTAAGNRATNSPFGVADGSTPITTVLVNQQMTPTDATGDGMSWQSLGVYEPSTGTLNVTLDDAANGYVIANAVCLVPTSAISASPTIVGTGDPGYSESPNSGWQSYADASAYNGDFRYAQAGTGQNTAQWTFQVDSTAQYQVYATWTAAGNRASNAPYTIADGSTALSTVDINQQFAPSDTTTSDGQGWESLGVYNATSGTLNVGLSDNANGIVVANGIRIVQVQAPTTPPTIVDNADPAFSETGTGWQGYNDSSSFSGGFRYAAAGTGQNTAQWTFTGVNPADQYQIYATWSAAGNRASNAPFTISDGSTALSTVNVNQQTSPSDLTTSDGQTWESLGVFTASSGTFNIGLSDNANGIVVADAIRIVQIQPAVAPSMVDNSDSGFTETGSGWQGYSDPSAVNGSFRYSEAASGEDTAQWTFPGVQPLAQYQIYATWTAGGDRASIAPYTISDGSTSLATVDLNQQFAPTDALIDGQEFESLGVFTAASGTFNIGLSDDANGIVVADAIRIVQVQAPTTPPTIVDNADAAFSEAGSGWQGFNDASAVNGGFRYAAAGSGDNAATWTFVGLNPTAQYQVYATWTAGGDRASNAPYTILDGNNSLAQVNINQQFAPSDATLSGQGWESLGVFTAASGILNVNLSDDANGSVIADAIRIVQVQPPSTPPTVVDNADAAFSETGTGWQGYNDGTSYNGGFRYAPAGTGQNTAQWNFQVDPTAQYQVFTTYSAAGDRANNAPYTIWDGGTSLGTVDMNQQFAPSDATTPDGQNWESLGTYQALSGSLAISLSDNANGIVVADAIRIVKIVPSSTALPAIIDNSNPGYAETGGGWQGYSDSGAYDGSFRYATPGTGSNTAQWTFQNLPNGEYQVQTTWTAAGNRADNAPYTIFDGTTSLATVPVNQQNAPTDATINGQGWANLGTFTIQSGKLVVSLSDNADGDVIADAVRLSAIDFAPTVLSAPTVGVSQGTVDSALNLDPVFNNPNGPVDELTCSVVANSNPTLIPVIWTEDQTLEFAAAPGLSGTSYVTIEATDAAGESVQATFPIIVAADAVPTAPSGLTAFAVSAGEIDLSWTNPNMAASGGTIQVQRATDAAFTQNVTLVTATAPDATSCADTGLVPGTAYYYRIWATSAAGNSAPSNTASAVTQAATALPGGWLDADIGGPALAGSGSFANGVYTVTGAGSDIASTADQFNFVSQTVSDDQTLIARVTSLGNTNSAAKSGVMLRDSTTTGSMFVDVVATPGSGVIMQWRSSTGGSVSSVTISGVAAPTSLNPVWVRLMKTGSNYAGYYSLNGTTWVQVGSANLNFSNTSYLAGLAVTSHNTAVASTATLDHVSLLATSVASAPLPTGWTDADIGGPSPVGTASFSSGIYTLSGGGSDIYNNSDQFNFASQTVTGSSTIIARITSLANTNGSAKTGVMFRDSSAAGSEFVAVLATPSSGVRVEQRSSTNGSTGLDTISGVAAPSASNPVWVMLVKSGSTFTGYYSLNGATWTKITTVTVTFTNTAFLAGLAVTSHDNGKATTTTLDNVSVSVLPAGWSDADIGSPTVAGSATYAVSTGVYTVTGGGTDIAGTSDKFNFASQPASGDQMLTARVTSQTNTSAGAKAGLMFRDTSANNSMFADIVATPSDGVIFQWRSSTGGSVTTTTLSGIAGPTSLNPVWLQLVKSGSLYTGYYSLDGSTWVEAGSASFDFSNTTYLAGMAVTGQSSSSSAATFDNVALTAAPTGTLPTGWTDADIGGPSPAGAASYVNGVYTISGSGADIYGSSDQFNFASQYVNGSQVIVARVTAQTGVGSLSKAGVMFRDSAAPGSMFVDLIAKGGQNVSMEWRSTTGGGANFSASASVAAPTAANPVWLKLINSGGTFTGYYSLDGSTWVLVTSTNVTFSNTSYLAGLAVTSHNNGTLSTATIDNLSINSAQWSETNVGLPSPAGSVSVVGTGPAPSTVYTVSGSGTGTSGTSDQFNFTYQNTTGSQTMVAGVTSQTNTAASAKAGVMFRDSTATNAKFVDVVATPSSGVIMQWRSSTGGSVSSAAISGIPAASSSSPVWLKLVDNAGAYTGYYSADGATWTQVGTASVSFSNTNYLSGLAVSSAAAGVLSTAIFDNVTFSVPATNNVALNAPVTVSSIDSAGHVGSNAVDGNAATAWTSAAGATQWIQVDLGTTRAVNEIQLNWGAAFASAYQIQISPDAVNWTTIYSTTSGQGGIQDLTGLVGSGEFVRLTATAGPQSYYTLNEFSVFPLTLTWAGGSGAWGPENPDWVGPTGQLQTWQDGSDAVFGGVGVPPSAGSPDVVSIYGQVSPHSITFLTDGYVLQAAADPTGDQIVLPTGQIQINVGAGTATINALISDVDGTSGLTAIGPGTLVLGAQDTYGGQTLIAGGTLRLGIADALPAATVVQVGDPTLGSGVLDLGGYGLMVAGLVSGTASATNVTSADLVTDSSATEATLTLYIAGTCDFEGIFSGNLGIAKYGPGTLTADSASTNTGPVDVYGGTLQIVGTQASSFVTDGGQLLLGGLTSVTGNPNPVLSGAPITLTAASVDTGGDPLASVSYYLDTDGNGVLDSGDQLLATATDGSDNWAATVLATGWANGPNTIFAQGTTASGAITNTVATTVIDPTTIILDDDGSTTPSDAPSASENTVTYTDTWATISGVGGEYGDTIHRTTDTSATATYKFASVDPGTYLLYEDFPSYAVSGYLTLTTTVTGSSNPNPPASAQKSGSSYTDDGVTWYNFAEVTITSTSPGSISVKVGPPDCYVITDAIELVPVTANLLVDSDNDDAHGAIDSVRPATSTLEDSVADEEPGKYIAVQANNASGSPLPGTSFTPATMVVDGFISGVTKVRFVANQLDLDGNSVADNSLFNLWSGSTAVTGQGSQIDFFPTHTYYVDSTTEPSYFDSSNNTFYLSSTTNIDTITFYVQALKVGIGNIELQINPTDGSSSSDWYTADTDVFTALDTNVGSPNGVTVTPAGFLTVIDDPLGVGSNVYMNSAQQANTQLTPNPMNATVGMPAHLVLTGNGVAVLDNDQIDIWDWENLNNATSPDWVLVPRKPQEQGTMVYQPLGSGETEGGTYLQTLPNGTVNTFDAPDPDDDSWDSPDDFGLLTKAVDAYGHETDYAYQSNSNQLVSEIWTVGPDVDGHHSQEQIAYTVSAGMVTGEKVTLGSADTSTGGTMIPGTSLKWHTDNDLDQTVGSATFVYNGDNLELIETFDDAGAPTGACYFRYDTTNSGGGVTGDLEYYLSPDSVGRLMAAHSLTFSGTSNASGLSSALDGLSPSSVATYADNYFTYNSPTGGFSLQTSRVASNAVQGSGTDNYSYALSDVPGSSPNFSDGINTWLVGATETLVDTGNTSDNSEVVTYSNFDGDTLLTDTSNDGTGPHWVTWNRYDQYANVLLAAQPSALTIYDGNNYDPTKADLIGFAPGTNTTDGTSHYLNLSTGLFDVNSYYSDPNTAADPSQPSEAGMLQASGVQQGGDTTPDWQSSVDYVNASSGDITVYETQHSTQYQQVQSSTTPPTPPSPGTVSGAETTTNSYTFSGVAITSQSTAQPAVDVDHGGTDPVGTTAGPASTNVYNSFGQLVWSQDAKGSISYTAYYPATGAVQKQIQDVNFDDSNGFPSGDLALLTNLGLTWSTTATTGRNLITTYVVDSQGRTTEEIDPDLNITYTVYIDAVQLGPDSETQIFNQVRTYPGWNPGTDTTTGAIQVSENVDTPTGSFSETLSYTWNQPGGIPSGYLNGDGSPKGTEPLTDSHVELQSLSRSLMNSQGQETEEDDYTDVPDADYSATSLDVDSDFDATTYQYDTIGNSVKTVDPDGNITRTVYDFQGRVTSTWVGKSDAVSGTWSPANPGSMVETSASVYDDGEVGDGDASESVDFPKANGSAAAASTFQVAQMSYDWQDRLVATKSDALVTESSGGFPVDGISSSLVLDPGGEGTGIDTTKRSITYDVLDNLGEATTEDVYAGDDVNELSLGDTNGVPNSPSSGLVSQTVSAYNLDGNEYDSQVDGVNSSGTTDGTTEDTTTLYDADGNQTGSIDPLGNVTATTYDDDGDDVADYHGQVITNTDPLRYSDSPSPTWTFSNLAPSNVASGSAQTFDVYVYSASGTPDPTAGDYTLKDEGGTLSYPTTDPNAPSLDGWTFLETVTISSGFTNWLSVSHSSGAPDKVCLLQQTTAMAYDGDDNVTATTDAMGRVTATVFDDDGRDVADYMGQVVNSVTNAPGYTPGSPPTWSFTNITPNYTGKYDIYVHNGDTEGTDYTIKQADGTELYPVSDPSAPYLGEGWSDLGYVNVTAGTSLTVSHGTTSAPDEVCLLNLTTVTAYDADGNVTATTNALGHVTATDYDDLGNDTADYQGQMVNESGEEWTFSNLTPNYLQEYDVYGYSTTESLTGADYSAGSTGTFTAATDPSDTPLGANWYFLGTVSEASGTTVQLTPGGTAATWVCLLQQTAATDYDGDGNVSTTIDAMGRVTGSSYNDLGQDVADYQGQVQTQSEPDSVMFSNLAPNSSTIASYTLDSTTDDQAGGLYNGTWVETGPHTGPATFSSGNYITASSLMPQGNAPWSLSFTFTTSEDTNSVGLFSWGTSESNTHSAIGIGLADGSQLTAWHLGSLPAYSLYINVSYGDVYVMSPPTTTTALNLGSPHSVVMAYDGENLTCTIDGTQQVVNVSNLGSSWNGHLAIASGTTYIGFDLLDGSAGIPGSGTIADVVMDKDRSATYDIYTTGSSVTGPGGMATAAPDPTAPSLSGGLSVLETVTFSGTSLSLTSSATSVCLVQETSSTTYDDDGNALTVTDGLGRMTSNTYNSLGQLVSTTDPKNNTTTYSYNSEGDQISETDPDGNMTSYGYTDFNQLGSQSDNITLSSSSSTTATTTNQYDADGNLVMTVDANAASTTTVTNTPHVTVYTYNSMNQRTGEYWYASVALANEDSTRTSALTSITYTYDADGELLTAEETSGGSPVSGYSYTYNSLGQQISVDNNATGYSTPGVPDVLLTSTYDADGNRKSLSAKIGGTADFVNNYKYDGQDREVQVTQSGTSVDNKQATFTYDADGEVASIDRTTGTDFDTEVATSKYGYDSSGDVVNLKQYLAGSETPYTTEAWTYDVDNEALSFGNSAYSANEGIASLSYDADGQLLSASPTGSANAANSLTNAYDSNGNATSVTVGSTTTSPSIGTDGNTMICDGTNAYQYDADGHMILSWASTTAQPASSDTGSITSYGWDNRGRLVSVTTYLSYTAFIDNDTPTLTIAYTYDMFNNLIKRTVGGSEAGANEGTERYVYDGQKMVLAFDGSNHLTDRYLNGPAVDQVLADERLNLAGTLPGGTSAGTLWALGDNQNTVRDVVDEAGQAVQHIAYSPFGQQVSSLSSNAYAADFIFGYTGSYTDPLTGFQLDGARWYDPASQRWLSQDPSGLRPDSNPYRYVGNGPTDRTDLSGLADDDDIFRQRCKPIGANMMRDGKPVPVSMYTEQAKISVAVYNAWGHAGYASLASYEESYKQRQSYLLPVGTFTSGWHELKAAATGHGTEGFVFPIFDTGNAQGAVPPVDQLVNRLKEKLSSSPGQITMLYICDHAATFSYQVNGNPQPGIGQRLGDRAIDPNSAGWKQLASMIAPDGRIVFSGCEAGKDQKSLEAYAKSAQRRVVAATGSVTDALTTYDRPGVPSKWIMATPNPDGTVTISDIASPTADPNP